MAKKYVVLLGEEERSELLKLTTSGSCPVRKARRANILLLADQGGEALTDKAISKALTVSATTIEKVRKHFVEEGLQATINRKKPVRDYKGILDGEKEAQLVRLACSEPPEGRSRWTLRLLAGRMVELEYVEHLSHETVRGALKKTNSNPGSRRNG